MAVSNRPFLADSGSVTIKDTSTSTSTDFTAEVKEISFSGGERDVELIRTFGNNQVFDEKPVESFEASFTILKQDTDFAKMVLGGSGTTAGGAAMASAYEVYPHLNYDVVLNVYDETFSGGEQLRMTLTSAFAVSKEMSLNATDHLEETVNFKCLPMNYKEEYTPDRAANALP